MWTVSNTVVSSFLIAGFGEGESSNVCHGDGNYTEYQTVGAFGFRHGDVLITRCSARTIAITTIKVITEATSSSSDDEVGAGGSHFKKGTPKKGSGKQPTGRKHRLTPTDSEWPDDVPKNFETCEKDWRDDGVLREEVSHQGTHELCWAISLRECIEASLNIKAKMERRNRHANLSAQHLVNNASKLTNGAMRRYKGLTKFLVENGLVNEDICNFTGSINSGCHHATPNEEAVTKIKGLKKKSILKKKISEEEVIKLVAKRPLMVELKAYDSLLSFKGDGIYKGPQRKEKEKQNNHAFLLIGYGTIDGIHYWLVKNSYGTRWGENGYGKIMRQCSLGNNAPSLSEEDSGDLSILFASIISLNRENI